MPGVKVSTGSVAGPSSIQRAPSGTYFAAGLTERGPVGGAITARDGITSMAAFTALYGPRPSYGTAWDDIRTYFEEGGGRLYFARVVGPAATTGALASPLVDGAGTPVSTMQVTARGPGAWSAGLAVEVVAGTIANTFTLRLRYQGVVVETYANLKSPQDAVARTQSSPWVIVSDLGSVTAAPGNNPAPLASTALTAGTDDRASVTSAHYITALARFERSLGDGAVAVPGLGDGVHAGLIAHAAGTNRVTILATARSTSKDDLIDLAASYDAPHAGLFAPWVLIPNGFGGTRAISPEGYIAGVRARAHESVGPWQAAAGTVARARFVAAPDQVFDRPTADDLDTGRVNVIVSWAGGTKNYGWRSLSSDSENWGLLTGQDTLNRVVTLLEEVLEDRVFGAIDARGQLLSAIAGDIEGQLAPLAAVNGLYAMIDPNSGQVIDPGYRITVNSTNNPPVSLAANQVLAEVAIRVSPSAATVRLTVSKAGVLAQL